MQGQETEELVRNARAERRERERALRELSRDGIVGGWIRRHFTPFRAVMLLTMTLFLNYVDRGIVAGAGTSIKGCMASQELCPKVRPVKPCPNSTLLSYEEMLPTLHDGRSSTCEQCRVCGDTCKGELVKQTGFGINTVQLGLLQSTFMVGYMVGAIVFAQLATRARPFRLISLGLFLWVIASIGSGVSGFMCDPDPSGKTVCWSYYLLVFTRALSGVGEASINTLALPFLDDILDPKSKGFYVGIYYTAIPVGTACGFMWAGLVSSATGGYWEWAFILETPIMLPFAFLCYHVPTSLGAQQEVPPLNIDDELNTSIDSEEQCQQRVERSRSITSRAARPRVRFRDNVYAVVSRPAWVFGVLGYAMYTGVVAGLAFYGPTFIQTYRPCDKRWDISQATADMIFGMVISLSGLIGTVLGGRLVDRAKSNKSGRKNRNDLVKQLMLQLAAGLVINSVAITRNDPAMFFGLLFFGCIPAFMVSAGVNMMLMWSVPKENRPMSSALSTLAIHLFGDVPSPVLIGWLSDNTSPLFTLAATNFCMLLAVFFWAIILCLPQEHSPQDEDSESDDEFDDTFSYHSLLD